jgi:hypothetical protein
MQRIYKRSGIMNSSWKFARSGGSGSSPHWSFLIALLWVASTSLATGAALALSVDAAFFSNLRPAAAQGVLDSAVPRHEVKGICNESFEK